MDETSSSCYTKIPPRTTLTALAFPLGQSIEVRLLTHSLSIARGAETGERNMPIHG
jgi:hypothetical protein